MPRPACITCQTEMVPTRNDVGIVLSVNDPVELYSGDLWECPTCGHQIVTGYGSCMAESWDASRFDALVAYYATGGHLYRINHS